MDFFFKTEALETIILTKKQTFFLTKKFKSLVI